MANILRWTRLWVGAAVAVAIAGALLAVVLLPEDSPGNIDRTLAEFIEDARAGRVQVVEVDGRQVKWKVIGDDRTYETRLTPGDTVRRVLADAGLDPEDFPPIAIDEP